MSHLVPYLTLTFTHKVPKMTTQIFNTPSGRVITLAESGLVFKSIADELYREYHYTNDCNGYHVERIYHPVALRVSESGGHYVIDKDDLVHYLPVGWTRLTWKVRGGYPLVAF